MARYWAVIRQDRYANTKTVVGYTDRLTDCALPERSADTRYRYFFDLRWQWEVVDA